MRKRDDDDDDGGLDSLLDTMTNVVGILVLVLIVTQMSVAEVVNRITSESTIDEETLEELDQQLVARREEHDELERMLVNPLNVDPEQQRKELELKKELLERRRKALAKKQKEKNEYALKIEQDREQAKKNKEIVADTEEQREKLQGVLEQSLERKAELQAKLETTPKTKAPADIEVSIPNPRPAPPGAKRLVIICAHNELYPLRLDAFREYAEAQAQQIIARRRLGRDPVAGIDPEKFTKFWELEKNRDEFFDVEYYVYKNRLRLRFIPRAGDGANQQEVANPRSRIWSAKFLGAIDRAKMYVRFYVLPDSFGVYITARRKFSEAGVLAGWQPEPEDWRYTTSVPGGILLGPPPPPKPPAPPPDPNAKPKKPKPRNVID